MSDGVPVPGGFLTEWCETMAHGTEMPPPAYLATGLVTAASIVGPRMFVRFSPTRRERCNLWVLNVGRSAIARKTTGMSAARWAVKVAADHLGSGLRWFAPQRLSDAGLASRLDVVGADLAEAQEAEDRAAKLEKREPRRLEPAPRATPVSWLMAVNELAPLWGEGLRDWQAATSAMLLDLFDGELSSDTKASHVPAQETFVCALGNMPPAELAARTTLGLLTSGFAGRWVLIPSPGPVTQIPFPRPNGTDPLASLAERVKALAALASGTRGVDVQALWPAGGEADVARRDWYVRWHAELRRADAEDREVAARADLFNRLQATALKLASIVAVTRQAHEVEHLADVRVSAFDAVWAQEVVDQSIAALMGVVRESGGGAATSLGRLENRIESYLRQRGHVSRESAVSFNRVAKACKNSDSHGEVLRALEGMISAEILAYADGVVGPRGGAPARVVWLAVD